MEDRAEARYWDKLEREEVPRIGTRAGLLVLVILGVAFLGDVSLVPDDHWTGAVWARAVGIAWTAAHTALAAFAPVAYRKHYRWVLVVFMLIVGVMCSAIGTWADKLSEVYVLGVVQAQVGYATFIPLRRRDMALGTVGASMLFLVVPFALGRALDSSEVASLGTVLAIFILLSLFAHHQLLGARVRELARSDELATRNGELQTLRNRLEDDVRARTRELSDAVAALQQSETHLRQLGTQLVRAREDEGKRISRELHDDLGQLLTGLKIGTQVLKRKLERSQEEATEQADRLKTITEDAISSVKRVTRELRPTMLDDIGLGPTLEWLVSQYTERTGIPCDVDIDLDEDLLDGDRRTVVFRVAQEALTNVARHANASRVDLALECDDGAVLLRVQDDGVGIEEGRLNGGGSGLIGMRERAATLGGTVSVQSHSGGGTRVQLSLPVAA